MVMDRFIGSNPSLSLGLAASLLLHGAGVTVLARLGSGTFSTSMPPEAPRPATDPFEVELPMVLGIESSPHQNDTWLGFADPTEHKAPAASVEQSAMDPDAGAPGATNEQSSPGSAGAQASQPSKLPQVSDGSPAAPADAPPEDPAKPDPIVPAGPEPERTEVESQPATDRILVDPLPVTAGESDLPAAEPSAKPSEELAPVSEPPVQPATPQQPQPNESPKVTESPRPAVVEPTQPDVVAPGPPLQDSAQQPSTKAAAPAGERPGEKTDRQSTASSLKATIEVIPGRTAAAQGLEIKTVRPRWSDTTRLTAAPRNPLVRVTFARTGKVTSAVFASGMNTGWKDVDDPLLDAIYRWSAKGEALRALPPDRSAGLTVQFRIMLR